VTAPIIGAPKLAQLDDPIAALDLRFDEESLRRLDAPYLPRTVAGIS
jgi:aryl-alcohol dehydrogenase-like predicted oxidoreductase